MTVRGPGDTRAMESCERPRRAAGGASWELRAVGAGVAAGPIPGVFLYLVGLGMLLLGPGQLPSYTYNWEHYTAFELFRFWDGGQALWESFVLNDGLMTTSGTSPVIALPALLIWEVLGVGLPAMRLATMLLAALAVPMLWLLARRLVGDGIALASAALLAVSPGFLFYGRTATSVGLSVGFALFTAYALFSALRPNPRPWVRFSWLGVFLAMLVVDAYLYSPIRFFWPLAVVALMVEVFFRREERQWFLPAGLLILIWMPLVLTLVRATGMTNRAAEFDIGGAVTAYYFARGEQIFSIAETPDGFEGVLGPRDEVPDAGAPESTVGLALALVQQNSRDLLNLMLDRETKPVISDFWNPRGRLYAGIMLPGVLLGLAVLFGQAWRRVEARLLLELVAVFTLPMLLTTRVHIGRLVFALPILLLIGVLGYAMLLGWIIAALDRWRPGAAIVLWPLRLIGAGLLILLLARASWQEMVAAPVTSPAAGIVATLVEAAATGEAWNGVAYVAGDLGGEEVEALDVAGYRLQLIDTYQFVNLAHGEIDDPTDPRPPLYYGGLLDLIDQPGAVPRSCELVYFVRLAVEGPFREAFAPTVPSCAQPPVVRMFSE